jgi:hypothetical protein
LLRAQLRSQGSDGEWLSFDDPPSEPASTVAEPEPAATYLSQAAASRIIELAPGMARWHTALSELEGTLSTWSLPTTLARRWLHAAQGLMGGDQCLELYVELDPVQHLITVELWDEDGKRVYGIDDFLAGPELSYA